MRYIETWLTGLGLDYIIPKLKAQGITTPKKLAALSLRDIYEVVGVEDTEDRKKLYFLIRRLKSILKSKSGDGGEEDEEEEEESADEPKTNARESKPPQNEVVKKQQASESKVEVAEIHPTASEKSPVERKVADDKAIAKTQVPETVESQEDLRRLRLNHRRQQQQPATTLPSTSATTSESALDIAPEVETPVPRATKTRPTRTSMAPSATVAAEATSSSPDMPSLPPKDTTKSRQDKEKEKEKEKPSMIAPPPSRLTRQASSSRQPADAPSSSGATTPPPAAFTTTEATTSSHSSSKLTSRPQTAPAPASITAAPLAATGNASKATSGAAATAQSVSSFEWQQQHEKQQQSKQQHQQQQQQQQSQKANNTQFASNNHQQGFSTTDDENTNERNVSDYTASTLRVVVRKRPLGQHELHRGERDIIETGEMGSLVVRDIKVKVDLTKVWQTIPFQFDDAFSDEDSNRTIYDSCLRSLLPNVLSEGMKVSCFTYGQTGSGKTYTMFGAGEHATTTATSTAVADEGDRFGLYHLCMADVLHMIERSSVLSQSIRVYLTCFEIYGEKLHDLLNNRTLVKNLEDAKQHVRIVGLTEHEVPSLDAFQRLLQTIVAARSTSSTGANHDSSRSHQVLEVSFKYFNPAQQQQQNQQQQHGSISRRPKSAPTPAQLPAAVMGKIVFVDLAGSEKAADTFMNAKSTRMEGADINTSLLALKEVFRSMEKKNGYMPFRGSKLTQVLKESLQGKSVRTCMIACVSPASSHYEQTMNTLRYAAKVYEVTAGAGAGGGNDAEESPVVAVTAAEDPRIVYTAADYQEMQVAADVLAQHSSKHHNHNHNHQQSSSSAAAVRAVSAPRGGIGSGSGGGGDSSSSRARSGSSSAANNSNLNRRISTNNSAKLSNNNNNNNNSNHQQLAEMAKLPVSRFLSSDDEPHQQQHQQQRQQVASSSTTAAAAPSSSQYYTAEDEYEGAHHHHHQHQQQHHQAASDRRKSSTSTATAATAARNRTTATTTATTVAPTSHVQSTHHSQQQQAERPSLVRHNSFAGHKSNSNNNSNSNNTATSVSQVTSPGRLLKRAASSHMTSVASTASNANSNKPPTSAPHARNSTGGNKPAVLASPSRRTLPDYPESSDAYEEDDLLLLSAPAMAANTTTATTATNAVRVGGVAPKASHQQQQQHRYQLEPVEATYYAANAHLTAESYDSPKQARSASAAAAENEEEEEDEMDDTRLGDMEDIVVDEGEAGDDEQDDDDDAVRRDDDDDDEEDDEEEGERRDNSSGDFAAMNNSAISSSNGALSRTEEMQMTWGLLSAHKLSIAEMVEVMKEEMELVQRMENVDERDTDGYLETLQAILTAKSLAVKSLRGDLRDFQQFRTEQRLYR